MYCGFCGSPAHTIALCPRTFAGSARRRNLRCSYCGGTDHDLQACPKTWSGNVARASHPDEVADHFVKDPWK